MRRTWQTDEMAVNRKKIFKDTHVLKMALPKQTTKRGNPSRADSTSESANEVRNILVSDLRVSFFLG